MNDEKNDLLLLFSFINIVYILLESPTDTKLTVAVLTVQFHI